MTRAARVLTLTLTAVLTLVCIVVSWRRQGHSERPAPSIAGTRPGADQTATPHHPTPVHPPRPTEAHRIPDPTHDGPVLSAPDVAEDLPAPERWHHRDIDLTNAPEEVDRIAGLLREAYRRIRLVGRDHGNPEGTEWSRRECLQALAGLAHHEDGCRRLVELTTRESDSDVALVMAEALSEVGTSGLLPEGLLWEMRDASPIREMVALVALRENGAPEVVAGYRNVATGDAAESSRLLAVDALGRSLATEQAAKTAPATLAVLQQLSLEDGSPEIREAAVRALGRTSQQQEEIRQFLLHLADEEAAPSVAQAARDAAGAFSQKRRRKR